jgi:uncharacterized protein (DUF2225 family)
MPRRLCPILAPAAERKTTMATLTTIELCCPVCEARFVSRAVRPAAQGRPKRTDFHEHAWDTPSLPHLVHVCRRCGYAALEEDFAADGQIGPLVANHIWDELAPRIGAEELAGSEKFEFAAKVATWQGATARHVADLWLRAAWCCVEEGDTEAERFYRRHAVWAFEDALGSYDGVPRDERAVITYLVGELWRRIGDEAAAAIWFDRVAEEITLLGKQRWILRVAAQQKADPREWFTP